MSNLVLFFLVEVARHVQNTQNRKLVIFLQYIKKKLSQLLRAVLWCKPVMFVVTCSLFLLLVHYFGVGRTKGPPTGHEATIRI